MLIDMRLWITGMLMVLILLLACSGAGFGVVSSEVSADDGVDWFREVQIYDMVAFPPYDVEGHHITVNGLWNGFMGDNLTSPFALGRFLESYLSGRTYASDEEFVMVQHEQGMLVPATILTTQGHVSFQGEFLEDFACLSIDGEMIPWDLDAGSFWMNANHPGFIDWCVAHGKLAIDAGADMIVLDEIQGNSLVPMFQLAAQFLGIPAPGFSGYTIEGFRSHLMNNFSMSELLEVYGIADIVSYDLASRIAGTIGLGYEDRVAADLLIVEYIDFLHWHNFLAKQRLIDELRAYVGQVGKDIVIGANSYTLGTNRVGGYWPMGMQFAEMVDVFTFENAYSVIEGEPVPWFPRVKWLAWEKLARAATDAPAVILIDTNALETINTRVLPLRGYSNYLSVLCAEAFANQGSFVDYYFAPFRRARNWRGCTDIYEFVLNHKELYDSNARIPTDVAVLYLWGEGMRYKSDSYLGCAQALAESQIPFDVVFDGDGRYLDMSLILEDIINYSLVVVPSVVNITEQQKMVIKDFVAGGGVAVVFDPDHLGFPLEEGEYVYGDGLFYFFTHDVGWQYYHSFDDSYREALETIVLSYVDEMIRVVDAGQRIVATPYVIDSDMMVVHIINYNHMKVFDFMWPKFSFEMRMKKPDFSFDTVSVISPDFSWKRELDVVDDGEYISFTVPYLRIYDLVVIE